MKILYLFIIYMIITLVAEGSVYPYELCNSASVLMPVSELSIAAHVTYAGPQGVSHKDILDIILKGAAAERSPGVSDDILHIKAQTEKSV